MGRYSYSQPSSSSYTSMSSTARRRSGGSYGFPKKCFCGLVPIMQTSRTVDNPGRRFYGCCNWEDGGYHLMKWWDEAMMEEFHELQLAVNQQGEQIDCLFVSKAENELVTTVHNEVLKTQKEIAQLKELIIEIEKCSGEFTLKRFGGVQLRNLMVAALGLVVVIICILIRSGGS